MGRFLLYRLLSVGWVSDSVTHPTPHWGGFIDIRHFEAKISALEIPGMNPTPQPPPRVRGGGERDGFGGGGLIEHRHFVEKIWAW
jgi:hypothetical protein